MSWDQYGNLTDPSVMGQYNFDQPGEMERYMADRQAGMQQALSQLHSSGGITQADFQSLQSNMGSDTSNGYKTFDQGLMAINPATGKPEQVYSTTQSNPDALSGAGPSTYYFGSQRPEDATAAMAGGYSSGNDKNSMAEPLVKAGLAAMTGGALGPALAAGMGVTSGAGIGALSGAVGGAAGGGINSGGDLNSMLQGGLIGAGTGGIGGAIFGAPSAGTMAQATNPGDFYTAGAGVGAGGNIGASFDPSTFTNYAGSPQIPDLSGFNNPMSPNAQFPATAQQGTADFNFDQQFNDPSQGTTFGESGITPAPAPAPQGAGMQLGQPYQSPNFPEEATGLQGNYEFSGLGSGANPVSSTVNAPAQQAAQQQPGILQQIFGGGQQSGAGAGAGSTGGGAGAGTLGSAAGAVGVGSYLDNAIGQMTGQAPQGAYQFPYAGLLAAGFGAAGSQASVSALQGMFDKSINADPWNSQMARYQQPLYDAATQGIGNTAYGQSIADQAARQSSAKGYNMSGNMLNDVAKSLNAGTAQYIGALSPLAMGRAPDQRGVAGIAQGIGQATGGLYNALGYGAQQVAQGQQPAIGQNQSLGSMVSGLFGNSNGSLG